MNPVKCQSCGAALPHGPPVTCTYCGAFFSAPAPGATPGGASVRVRSSGAGGAVIAIVLIVGVLGVGITIAAVVMAGVGAAVVQSEVTQRTREIESVTIHGIDGKPAASNRVEVKAPTKGAEPPVEEKKEKDDGRQIWDDNAPSFVVEVDGEESLLGRMRLGTGDELHIVAHAAATTEEQWRVGPLGSYSEAYSNTKYIVAGDWVVIIDRRGALQLVDLDSGEVKHEKQLPERATDLCVDGSAVWIKMSDLAHLRLELPRSGLMAALGAGDLELKEAPKKPKDCVLVSTLKSGARRPSASRIEAPKVEGFSRRGVVVEADLGVVSGTKSPGTAVPQAVGFDPGTLEVRWHRPLVDGDPLEMRENSNHYQALAGETYLSVYGRGPSEWRLVALHARTGESLWDVGVGTRHLRGLKAGPGYAYVHDFGAVRVLDAKTGEEVGQIGR